MKIERPRFLAGARLANDERLAPYTRRPRSLRETVWRPSNFNAATIAPRQAPDFDQIRALDEKNEGMKVQLGDKTLAALLAVQVPDPSDVSWLTEKARRLAAGESEANIEASPPFGREQRTITRRTNLADAKLSTDAQIQAVQASLAQGSTDVARIGAAIAQIIVGQTTTNAQLAQLAAASQQLGIPKDWRTAGFTHRLFSQTQFKSEEGKVMLFLLANIPSGFDDSGRFLVVLDKSGTVVSMASIRNISARLHPDSFLDIENRAIIPVDWAKDLALNDNVDNGVLDLGSISQSTPGKPRRRP